MATKNNLARKAKSRKEPAMYHDAAFSAFSYLLREYVENGDVTLQDERRLSKQPLKIDIMIIKKKRDVEIETSWGRIFRGHNIIEYKSPVDTLVSLSVFNKVIHGYAGVYASQEEVSLADMSATIVCFKRPVELFEVLKKELNYKILHKSEGIYHIILKGAVAEKALAVQIAVYSEMTDSDLLLKGLKPESDSTAIEKLSEIPIDEILMPWWNTMFSINGEILLKEAKVDGIKKALKYWESKGHLADYEQGWKQEGWREGRQETAAQLLQFLESGHSIQEAREKFLVTS